MYVTISFLLVGISERKSKELVQGISDCYKFDISFFKFSLEG